uniref:Uncharacterized protein n=1 Tax=Arundo donax TaxID=35708 RepID=A0A0A8Z674_ARUDO
MEMLIRRFFILMVL